MLYGLRMSWFNKIQSLGRVTRKAPCCYPAISNYGIQRWREDGRLMFDSSRIGKKIKATGYHPSGLLWHVSFDYIISVDDETDIRTWLDFQQIRGRISVKHYVTMINEEDAMMLYIAFA